MKLAIVRASGMEARVEWGKKASLKEMTMAFMGKAFWGKVLGFGLIKRETEKEQIQLKLCCPGEIKSMGVWHSHKTFGRGKEHTFLNFSNLTSHIFPVSFFQF